MYHLGWRGILDAMEQHTVTTITSVVISPQLTVAVAVATGISLVQFPNNPNATTDKQASKQHQPHNQSMAISLMNMVAPLFRSTSHHIAASISILLLLHNQLVIIDQK